MDVGFAQLLPDAEEGAIAAVYQRVLDMYGNTRGKDFACKRNAVGGGSTRVDDGLFDGEEVSYPLFASAAVSVFVFVSSPSVDCATVLFVLTFGNDCDASCCCCCCCTAAPEANGDRVDALTND